VSRALVTFAVGDHERLLDLALPGFVEYAERQGYDLLTDPPTMLMRPPSWGKLPAVRDALDQYDEVLWIDADVVILDPTDDISADVPADAWQAITRHHTPEGEIPSCGVWLVRRPMWKTLEDMWRQTRYLDHPWWEQAALLHTLGYNPNTRPVERPNIKPRLYDRTHWVGVEWNALHLEFPSGLEEIDPVQARFVHCGPGSTVTVRAQMMQTMIETGRPLAAGTKGA
jgi:hypothetical protein